MSRRIVSLLRKLHRALIGASKHFNVIKYLLNALFVDFDFLAHLALKCLVLLDQALAEGDSAREDFQLASDVLGLNGFRVLV